MKHTPPRVLSVTLTLALTFLFSNAAFGQAQTLFSEDFENGAPGWTYYIVGGGIPANLWHIAPAGQCTAAASSKMCAYNDTDCNYQNSFGHGGVAETPLITLSGQPPYSVSFKHLRSVDLPGMGTTLVEFFYISGGVYQLMSSSFSNTTTLQTITQVFPVWVLPGEQVRVRFRFFENPFGNSGFGWLVDDVVITNSGPPAPTVTSATPTHSTTSGGASILIDGVNFNNATTVNFGSNSASFAVLDDTQILATLPANLTPGYVNVSVTTASGTGTLTNGFDYFIAPASYGASTGTPTLAWDPSSLPIINETLTFDIDNFAPGSLVWYWAGESNSDWGGIPLPLDTTILGLPNCTILASAEYVLAEGYSGSSLPTPIPNMGALVGNHFYFQTFVFDAGTSAIVSTNAYDVVMGN